MWNYCWIFLQIAIIHVYVNHLRKMFKFVMLHGWVLRTFRSFHFTQEESQRHSCSFPTWFPMESLCALIFSGRLGAGADFLAVPKHTKAAMPVACALDETPVFTCVSVGCRHLLHCGLYSNDILGVRPISYLIFTFNLLTSVWCILTCSMVFPPHSYHPTACTQMLGNEGFYGIKGFEYIQVSS